MVPLNMPPSRRENVLLNWNASQRNQRSGISSTDKLRARNTNKALVLECASQNSKPN